MRAEIISIGTELLLGEIVDTNAPFLASQLPLLGINLYFITAIGDNYERLIAAFRQARQRSELILTTGGLGPTQDDLTREAIAGLLDQKLELDLGLQHNNPKSPRHRSWLVGRERRADNNSHAGTT